MEKQETLQKWIDEANHIVFFGGAGVSTESGIPDFRSKDGLYSLHYPVFPEIILSHAYFVKNPKEFYRFYRDKMNSTPFKPNITHQYLASLENKGKSISIITQNIDGLHTKAGSKNVIELHGNIYQNYCIKCSTLYDENIVFNISDPLPTCPCGGIIKPGIVLYGEPLDNNVWEEAVSQIKKADLLIIGGTSLMVYPARNLIHYFKGKHLVIINSEITAYDREAELVFHSKLGSIFEHLSD